MDSAPNLDNPAELDKLLLKLYKLVSLCATDTDELISKLDNAIDADDLLPELNNFDGLCDVDADDLPFQVFSEDCSRG